MHMETVGRALRAFAMYLQEHLPTATLHCAPEGAIFGFVLHGASDRFMEELCYPEMRRIQAETGLHLEVFARVTAYNDAHRTPYVELNANCRAIIYEQMVQRNKRQPTHAAEVAVEKAAIIVDSIPIDEADLV